MLATNRTSRCMHWMPADWLRRSLAGVLGETPRQARRTQFRIGRGIAGLPRGREFCWRRFRRVPCLIRSGRAAAVPEVAGEAVAGAEAVGQVVAVPVVEAEAAGVVLEELGAAPEELVVGAEAAVRAERVVAPGVGPAAELAEARAAGASIPVPI